MNPLLLAVGALVLTSCEKDAQTTTRSSNPDISVDLLFEHEGCRVFRFEDGTHLHYFVKCASGSASTSTAHSQYNATTKTTDTVIEDIPTETVRGGR